MINVLDGFRVEQPGLDFVLPGLTVGTIGSIVSPGGAGKSMFAIELAILVATGFVDISGFGNGTVPSGPVVMLCAEDPALAIMHRMFALGRHMQYDWHEIAATNLIIEPLVGYAPDLLEQKWFDAVFRVADGKRLVILDTLRRFHTGEENDSRAMSMVLAKLEHIAVKTGCALVFLHHSSKAAALGGLGDQQQASRGSSVLTDNTRWQAYLSGMTKDEAKKFDVDESMRGYFVRAGVSKQNFGPPVEEKWLHRVDGGVLVPAHLSSSGITKKKTKKENNDEYTG